MQAVKTSNADRVAATGPLSSFDCVVSGGGFAGLALALALAEALGDDFRVAVIDRRRDIGRVSADSRSYALAAGGKRLLDVLGVWAAVAGEAQPVARIDITDSTLESQLRPVILSYDNHIGGTEPATYIVPHMRLLEALIAAVQRHPSIRLVEGAAAGLTVETSRIVVGLTDGRRVAGSLAVAAEGRRSALREAAGIRTIGWNYNQSGIVTTVAHARPHGGVAVQHFLPAGPFAILPLPGNRSCITWSEEAAEARRIMALDDTGFLSELEKRFGGRLGELTLAGPRQSWPLEMHLARRYVAGRLALIGDTAHGVHPIAGQGLNLALRDVAALAEVVTDAARLGLDIGNADTLAGYERWRRFDSSLSAAAFDAINRLFSSDGMLTRAVRDAGLGIVERLPQLKQFFVQEGAGVAGDIPRLMRGERL